MSLRFDHITLENGLTVVGEHNPQAQSFAAGYFVNTGARDEHAEVAGVSHFLEHMMFKGTDRRSAEAINREFDELGANYNAYTSEERTVYYGAVLPERAERLLDLLCDMMRPALRQDDFDLEKNVILEEIAMYDDRPNVRVFDQGGPLYYQGHPLGNSVLGTQETIRALSRDAMLGYFSSRYAANNLVLTVAGNYDWQAVTGWVKDLTHGWQSALSPREHPEVRPASGVALLHDDKVRRAHLATFAPGVAAQDPRRYAAALLANCLGDSSGSRLYWALVETGLVDAASLSHDASDGAGSFVGYISTAPEQAQQVLDVFRQELASLQQGGLAADEWGRAQRKLATGLTLRGETPFGRLMSLGVHYQLMQGYHSVQDVVDTILGTPLEAGQELLAARPFEQLFVAALGPMSTLA